MNYLLPKRSKIFSKFLKSKKRLLT